MPRGDRGGDLEVSFDTEELRRLVADLKQLDDGRPILNALRSNLRKAGEPIKRQVQANAAWSSRIPAAVAIATAFSAKNAGILLKVNAKKAPEARVLENRGQTGTFRHPVFGNNKVWVTQHARPFFFDEVAQHMPEVAEAADAAMAEAATAAGFH